MNNQRGTMDSSKFSHLKDDGTGALICRIEKGDRIRGDELLKVLRIHKDGPLPPAIITYLEKPLSGWVEKNPGPQPRPYSEQLGEKIHLSLLYSGFKAYVDGRGDDLEIIAEFAAAHLSEIDVSFSKSEKASRLVALYLGRHPDQGPGILNKIFSRK